MALRGGSKWIKYLLILFSFFFWMCGVGLISLGVVVQMAMKDTLSVHSTSIVAAPIVLIAVGVIIFFMAFFGCCGAWKEHRCSITTFAVILSFIILSEIGGAVAGYVMRGKVNKTVEDGLKNMIAQYNSSNDAFRKAVDKMQQHLKCCGTNSSTDWANYTSDHQSVPDSCCKNLTSHCGSHALYDDSKIYQTGCISALEALLKRNMLVVVCVAVLTGLLQVLGVVYACVLIRSICEGYEQL